jgi:hypothetical protein
MALADLQRDSQLPPGRHELGGCLRGAPHPFLALTLSGALLLLAVRAVPAHAVEPDWTPYNVPPITTPPPPDGSTAAETFAERANQWTEYIACGEENSFLGATQSGLNNPKNFYAFLGMVIAKLQWLKSGHSGCHGKYNVIGNFYDPTNFPDGPSMQALMVNTFGSDCSGATEDAATTKGKVTSVLSAACLKVQVNFVLNHVQELDTYPGTDPLPCNLVGSQKGDWDVRMKDLIRIIFLDSRQQGDSGIASVLSVVRPDGRTTRDYILQDLITVDGGPGPDSYSWLACGDNEKDTGPPQDREDENSSSDDFWDSVGDFFSWLFKRLLLLVGFLTAAGLLALVPGVLGAAAAALVPLGLALILPLQIPETENHRLMIESTRFLNNQLIIQALGPANAPGISSDQNDVKSWLLSKFQSVAQNDFIEYNARPYQQYSLTALRNLADFATDSDVRNGAQMLLEYSAAKFALGSNQGRRLVPFRRRLPAVSCILGQNCEECYINPGCHTPPPDQWHPWFEIFHPKSYADFQVQLGLLFNGQTQQLLNGMTPADMLDAATATSQFIFNPLITDLAIQKNVSYFQRIHHAGYEAYSSSPNALITAGGIEAGHANHLMIGPIPIPTPFDPSQDIGAGLPTTVIFTGDPNGVTANGQSKMAIGDFIMFQGNLKTEGSAESFTDNLCVWRNFACGINAEIPPDIIPCLAPALNQVVPHWFYFDSSACDGYKIRPNKFYMVIYLVCGQNACFSDPTTLNPSNAGFLEVVDNPSDAFDVFQAKVQFNNPHNPSGDLGSLGQGCLTGDDCEGHYHTFSGHDLELALRGHQDDSDKTGINSVDGVNEKDLNDWNFADGDIISSQGDGVIAIKNPRLGVQVILDFGDPNHPCRRTGPSQPCVQQ